MYATKEDLATHLGIDVTGIFKPHEDTLASANDIIETFTLGRINTGKVTHSEAAKRAALLQYDYLTLMPQLDIIGGPKSIAAGGFNMQMDTALSDLAPRARRVLFNVGLMYRGVNSR